MLGIFQGRDKKPGPPKNQIELVCPVCGGSQYEPRLVVTTFCRKCGEHLRIEKKKVIASSQINPVPSSVFPAVSELEPPSPATRQEPTKPSDFRERRAAEEPPQNVVPPPESDSEPAPLPESAPQHHLLSPEKSEAGVSVLHALKDKLSMPSAANEGAAAQAPLTASTLQKMKDQGYYRQQYFKDVDCFDCKNKFKVGRSAKSTNCPACGAYICLEDFDINLPSTSAIRTRGDVIIRKNGNVSTSEIKCRDLRVQGMVSANIECSGDLIMRTSGTIIGEVQCKKMVIEKGSDIQFVNTIHAEDIEVHGRITGNVYCSHQVTIGTYGWISGDVTARSVSIEPGGQLDGAMNILRPTSAKQALPAGFSTPPVEAGPESDAVGE